MKFKRKEGVYEERKESMKKGRVMNCLISVLLVILTLFTSVSMVYAEEEEASQDQDVYSVPSEPLARSN